MGTLHSVFGLTGHLFIRSGPAKTWLLKNPLYSLFERYAASFRSFDSDTLLIGIRLVYVNLNSARKSDRVELMIFIASFETPFPLRRGVSRFYFPAALCDARTNSHGNAKHGIEHLDRASIVIVACRLLNALQVLTATVKPRVCSVKKGNRISFQISIIQFIALRIKER